MAQVNRRKLIVPASIPWLSPLLAILAGIALAGDAGVNGDRKGAKSPGAAADTARATILRSWPSVEAFLASQRPDEAARVRGLPIRKDIHRAVVLATGSLCQHVNRDRWRRPPIADPANRLAAAHSPGSLPELYWGADCLDGGKGRFGPASRRHALESGVSHVVGRALWAILLAEEAAAVVPPKENVEILRSYCREMYDNPDHLPAFFDPENGYRRSVICHDLREGFLGLLALARVRRDPWAAEELRRELVSLERITDAAGHLSVDRAREAGIQAVLLGTGNDATTCGRLVEPLVEYYQFSGESRALHLAGRLAKATLASTFAPDGRFLEVERSSGHIHSMTSSLCGITRYALLAQDRPIVDHCRRILDVGVPEYASSWGWVDEVMPRHPANEIGRGEINQTGDVIRTALALGRAGDAGYYDLAERYLRSTLLPVQHHAEDLRGFLKPANSPVLDCDRDVPGRVVGGYSMFFPNDRMKPGAWPLTTQDIISGAVHALCECWRNRCTAQDGAVRINLLFDYAGPEVIVTSGLPLEGKIAFRAASCQRLLVRIPAGVDAGTIRLRVGGADRPVHLQGGYVNVEALQPGVEGTVQFALPCKIQAEVVDGTRYTSTWIGSQIIDIQPRGTVSPLPF